MAGEDEHPTEVDLVSNDYGNQDVIIPAIADMKTYRARCKELELSSKENINVNVRTMLSHGDSVEKWSEAVKVHAEAKKVREEEKKCILSFSSWGALIRFPLSGC